MNSLCEFKIDHEAARRAISKAKKADLFEEISWQARQEKPQKILPAENAPKPLASGGELVFNGSKFVRVGDADDSTPIATPYPAKEIHSIGQCLAADLQYLELAKDETGTTIPEEQITRRAAEKAENLSQSHEIARRLGAAGIAAYREDGFFQWKYWIHSKVWEPIPPFRRICLIPHMAAIIRSQKLAALEYFVERNLHCRFWTFTSGLRVGLGGLRARIQYLHAHLNRLNVWLHSRWGMELVFRSTEFGTLEFDEHGNSKAKTAGEIEIDTSGEPQFHVHAHCVVRLMRGVIPAEQWPKLLSEVREFWGHNWDDGGVIANARECCKYVTKPGDMLKLTPEQLAGMFRAVNRLKLCQPLGTLAEEISDMLM